jgi:hypothetical protein
MLFFGVRSFSWNYSLGSEIVGIGVKITNTLVIFCNNIAVFWVKITKIFAVFSKNYLVS